MGTFLSILWLIVVATLLSNVSCYESDRGLLATKSKLELLKHLSTKPLGVNHSNQNKLLSEEDYEEKAVVSNGLLYKGFIAARAVYLFLLFLPVVLTSLLAYLSSTFRNYIWYRLLALSIANSGAAFIKWAQWSSTRSDMFPLELCRILGSLQTDAPAHSYGFTKKSIESEFGQPIDKVFYYFEKKPIASGSIAQIHRALIDNRLVAVKVRHPNVETQIHMDFDIMSAIAKLIDSLPGMGWINLQESMAQFSKTIASQVRLDIEGASLTRFINNFQHWKDVDFPHPLFESESVLVESFLNGDNVSKMIHTIRQNPQKYELLSHFVVTKGEDIYLKMLIEDNLMHADLHPGNILLEISSKAGNHKITDKHIPNFEDTYFSISLVDAGMVARLTNSQKHNFIGLLEALGEGNAMEATDCIIQFSSSLKNKSFTKESVKYRALLDGMTELFSQRCKGYGTNVDIGEVLRGILNLVRIHQISIEANYATLVMNALCLDGLAKDMLPTYNVLDGAKQLLRLNRRCRRLPLPTALMQGLIKTFYPVAQNGKRRSDKKFLRLLRQQKDSLV